MTRRAEPGRDPITARLLAAAREEADRARHGYVGCEHLLLALLTDKDPTARDILADHRISLPAARAAVAGVVSSGSGDGPRWSGADLLATLTSARMPSTSCTAARPAATCPGGRCAGRRWHPG
jgi:ATP-dependent Clp protease ATP-binding subunit ClpA